MKRLTTAAGWLAIAFGAVHTAVAPWDYRNALSEAVEDGWWNTFTLDKSATIAQFERSEAFWVSLGSFGVPMLVLGCLIVWSTRQGQRVPGWLGWILIAWALFLVTALPVAPGWVIPIVGVLIILGDKRNESHREAQ